jgi:20S proteasome alpha/beta subunit
MTLIVAIRYQNGVVMACDSRAIVGESVMRNEERKYEFLGNDIAIVGAGMAGFESKVRKELTAWFSSYPSPTLEEVIRKCEDILWDIHQRYLERFKNEEEEPDFVTLVLATHNRIFRIFENGYAEEEAQYACEGSGLPYGEYILSQKFKPDMSKEEAKWLATYAIIQTSRIDPAVGGRVNLILVEEGQICSVDNEEIDRIIENMTAIETITQNAMQEIIEKIVENRRWVNAKFKEKFGFELLEQNEFAISRIQKTCKNEADFTERITTLGLLVDGVNVSALDKMIGKHPPGSVNALEMFLNKEFPNFDKKVITNLREIMVLRSKKMPIHEDDPKIVQVLLKWEYRIPPDWSSLWMKALQKYMESVAGLKGLL